MYFNEFDPFASRWLSSIWPDAFIDQRSIRDVQPADLAGHRRCHFFGGIGGWELALRIAGWPEDEEVWTGSCPCQPYSCAGKRKGNSDDRNLWPVWFPLIRSRRPRVIFGEQVASADVVGKVGNRVAAPDVPVWLDGVFADMEAEGYSCGATVLGAHSVGAPHIRQRVFWVSVASGTECRWRPESEWKYGGAFHVADGGGIGGIPDAAGVVGECRFDKPERGPQGRASDRRLGAQSRGLVLPSITRLEGHTRNGDDRDQPGWLDKESDRSVTTAGASGPWSDYDVIPFGDGKSRRIEPGLKPLVDGFSGRVGRIRGYGNAIVPLVAAEFIAAFMEICATGDQPPC